MSKETTTQQAEQLNQAARDLATALNWPFEHALALLNRAMKMPAPRWQVDGKA